MPKTAVIPLRADLRELATTAGEVLTPKQVNQLTELLGYHRDRGWEPRKCGAVFRDILIGDLKSDWTQ